MSEKSLWSALLPVRAQGIGMHFYKHRQDYILRAKMLEDEVWGCGKR